MGKPKENTIAKIDDLNSILAESALSEPKKELIAALAGRCHSMNIHKAKLVYFKEIKLLLTKCLAAVESGEITADEGGTTRRDSRFGTRGGGAEGLQKG
ncbi:MAG: hypothetical protein KJ717_03970, partial [Proteobacteria bacterium]|nr:hypothetical protein [Pseudomonadota bacterium]